MQEPRKNCIKEPFSYAKNNFGVKRDLSVQFNSVKQLFCGISLTNL